MANSFNVDPVFEECNTFVQAVGDAVNLAVDIATGLINRQIAGRASKPI